MISPALIALASAARADMARVAQLEQELSNAKFALRDLLENVLPEAMATEDLNHFALDDGTTVTLDVTYHGGIRRKDEAEAHQWLQDHGFSKLIKREVTVHFGMGELAAGQQLMALLQEHFPTEPATLVWSGPDNTPVEALLRELVQRVLPERTVTVVDTVHPSSLKALIRKQIESGKEWPAELFGAFRRTEAQIVPLQQP